MSQPVARRCVGSFTAILLAIGTYAYETASAGDPPTVDKLPAAARNAKADFRPLTETDLANAKLTLVKAVDQLDQRLRADAGNGDPWRKYVRLDPLWQELGRDKPDTTVLAAIYEKFNAGHEGLRLVWFSDVRLALMRYLDIANALANSKLKDEYEQLMDALASHLEKYAAKPNPEEAMIISRALSWLENTAEAPLLVEAIRQNYTHCNLFLETSATVVAAGIAGPVDDVRPLQDCILGTSLSGMGHTTGETTCQLVPDPDRAVVDTILLARTVSPTVGYHHPVQIHSNSITDIGACKRMWIDAAGLSSFPAVSNAATATAICNICPLRGGAMVERIAWRRAEDQKGQAQWIAGRHAEQRVNAQVDAQAAPMLSDANDSFMKKFRKPLLEHKLFPEELHFSTISDALHVISLVANAAQLAAPGPAPALTASADISLRVHESMINNMAQRALAGMTVHEESFRAGLTEILGKLPERMEQNEDEEPWAISFADEQPITVTFADERFTIVVRGDRYYRAKESTPGLVVTAVYEIVPTGQQFKAVRQGPIKFTPTSDRPLVGREIPVQTVLEQRFNKLFEEEFVAEGFTLSGRWEKAGKMQPVQIHSQNGWLTVLWNAMPLETPPAESK